MAEAVRPDFGDRDHRLVVALDARLRAGEWGGVQQVVQGLAGGLSALDGPEDFVFVAYEDAAAWLDPQLGGRVRRVAVGAGSGRTLLRRSYDAISRRSGRVGRLLESAGSRFGGGSVPIPSSDGTIERLNADVVHFLLPQAYRTSIPSLYQVHDLLHVHYPEVFSPLHRRYREQTYSTFARQAACVATMTEWGRRQIVEQLRLPPSRIAVVPWAPVVGKDDEAGAAMPAVPSAPFILYPAQTWRHKNHQGLIEAIAILRNRGVPIDLVSVGHRTTEYASLERRVHELNLDGQVRFLGLVSAQTLGALYRRAAALVFPSRFEGFGLPIVEAFALGLPVAASNAAAIPEVAGGAALLFDPQQPSAIAGAIERIVSDEALRADLRARGLARAATMSWTESAKRFRALYRRIAGRPLTDEDLELLKPPVLVE